MMTLQWSCGCAYMSHYENVPFEVPEGWSWCTLDELTTSIGDGLHGTPKFDDNGEYYFVNGNNLDGIISIKKETKRTTIDEYTKQGLKFNSQTIFVSINGTLGNIAFYNNEPIVLGKSACYINLLDSISKEYIATILRCQYFINYCRDTATGSTIKNVPLAAMRTLFIPIPSYQEQLRIVDEVEKLLSLVDLLDENTNELGNAITVARSKILDLAIHGKLVPQDANDEPASELLKRINSKAVASCDNPQYEQIPDGWSVCALDYITDILNGYAFKSDKYVDNGIRVIRIMNVQDGYIEDDSPKYYPMELLQEIKNYILNDGDLLMSLTGNVGRVGVISKQFLPAALNQRVACIRITAGINKEYLYYVFLSNTFKKDSVKSSKGVAQLNMSTEWLKQYKICIPPYNEQIRIVSKVKELFSQLDMIEKSLQA